MVSAVWEGIGAFEIYLFKLQLECLLNDSPISCIAQQFLHVFWADGSRMITDKESSPLQKAHRQLNSARGFGHVSILAAWNLTFGERGNALLTGEYIGHRVILHIHTMASSARVTSVSQKPRMEIQMSFNYSLCTATEVFIESVWTQVLISSVFLLVQQFIVHIDCVCAGRRRPTLHLNLT